MAKFWINIPCHFKFAKLSVFWQNVYFKIYKKGAKWLKLTNFL
ncbi:hypothetical protein CHAB381_0410 [Campylobacter hominis ATCC BAA-381]|uniref:Uncharacterized protein n=1 Tax=Campylobacter hominis (strain ATCC BAA-381 / DSM 21671 / CCUG 45161 / LMG 19568 / NCTC 13146 / CH001A) TaxID=360107 RepID=A7I0G8_CAMHC|nr:hypothetical protein CHAB381_0410 [Campylobacter hominis ATCC BAA-381]